MKRTAEIWKEKVFLNPESIYNKTRALEILIFNARAKFFISQFKSNHSNSNILFNLRLGLEAYCLQKQN